MAKLGVKVRGGGADVCMSCVVRISRVPSPLTGPVFFPSDSTPFSTPGSTCFVVLDAVVTAVVPTLEIAGVS